MFLALKPEASLRLPIRLIPRRVEKLQIPERLSAIFVLFRHRKLLDSSEDFEGAVISRPRFTREEREESELESTGWSPPRSGLLIRV